MSFADLERGEGGIRRQAPGPSPLGGNGGNGNRNGNGNGHNGNSWGRGAPANFDDGMLCRHVSFIIHSPSLTHHAPLLLLTVDSWSLPSTLSIPITPFYLPLNPHSPIDAHSHIFPSLLWIIVVNQHAYQSKIQQISQQVFRISSNVSSIQRLVGYLGTLKDTQDIRTKL